MGGKKNENHNDRAAFSTKISKAVAAKDLKHRYFLSAREALAEVIQNTSPSVVGLGEYHQTAKTVKTLSALERFRVDLLPVLAPGTSDLILETWLSEGNCGATEKTVTGQVSQVSQRPDETENETLRLLKSARRLGIKPHILEMRCTDYDRVIKDGGVDYFEMLNLVARRLEDKAEALFAQSNNKKMKIIYSGAIHNDLAPDDDFAEFTYAPKVARAAKRLGGKFVEIDLYVPEFIETSETAKLETWYSQFVALASKDKAVLIELSESSFIIGFRRGVSASKAKSLR